MLKPSYSLVMLMVKVTVEVLILFEYLFRWCLLNDLTISSQKLSMVMHHHEPGCHMKKLFCYLQGQGQMAHLHVYYQNITISTISSELLILLQAV